MNDYTKVKFTVTPNEEVATDVLAALLAEVGFESFVPEEGGMSAYVPQALHNEESIAAVVAETPVAADAALRAIKVEYEELPFYLDPREAMKEGAVQIQENKPGNICGESHMTIGDYDAVTAEEGLLVFDDWFHTPTVQHCHIEVHECFAYEEAGKIVVVQDKETIEQLRAMNAAIMGQEGAHPFYGAPTVCVVLYDTEVYTGLEDASLVMGNLMNAAHSLGVASCWIHRAKQEFDSPEGKALLRKWGIEEKYTGCGHCILGYADEAPDAKPRNWEKVKFVD